MLAELVPRLAGLRPPLGPDPFESLVTSITAQQISLVAAVAIRNRLIERLGEPGRHAYAFPARDRVAACVRGRADRPRLLAPARRST